MISLRKKVNPRRKQVRDNIAAERSSKIGDIINSGVPVAILIMAGFIATCSILLSIHITEDTIGWKSVNEIISVVVVVFFVALAIAFHIHHYQGRIIRNYTRILALAGLFILLVASTRFVSFYPGRFYLAIGTVVTCAMVLTIAYNQRFAMNLSILYSVLAYLAVGDGVGISLFLTMMAGVFSCCFALKEIRTRMKLLEVSVITDGVVFIVSVAIGILDGGICSKLFSDSGWAAAGIGFTLGHTQIGRAAGRGRV